MCNVAFFRGPAHRCSANTVPLQPRLCSLSCSPSSSLVTAALLPILSEASVHSGSAECLLTSWLPWLFPPRGFWGVFLYQLWPLHTTTSPSAWLDLGQASCFLPLPGTSWFRPDQAGSLPVPLSTPRISLWRLKPNPIISLDLRKSFNCNRETKQGVDRQWETSGLGAKTSRCLIFNLTFYKTGRPRSPCEQKLNLPILSGKQPQLWWGSSEFLQLRTLFTDSLQP